MAVLTASPAHGSVAVGPEATVEIRTLEIVNAARKARGLPPLATHAGLRDEAREHSRDMSLRRQVGHWGFEERLQDAAPDPRQSRSGPDDGIWGISVAACENAAMRYRAGTTSETAEQVAQGLYTQWKNSSAHAACLFDSGRYGHNAAGLGVVRDARGAWWATLEIARDYTPPRGCAVDASVANANACPAL